MPPGTRVLLPLAVLAASLAACARQVDTSAEERIIRELDRTWVQAVAARDTMTIGDFYADDGEFLPQGGPRVTGRAAIRSAWAQMFQAPNMSLTFEPSKITVASAGDVAYETGAYTLGFDGPKGRIESTGKFVVVWKQVNGQWKAHYDIFNSDKPAM